MGADTSIAWCDDTLNVWHGCAKVDPLCKFCYAEMSTPVRVKRAAGLEVWGASAARSETKSWEANLRSYARRAVKEGRRRRVFAQSLSDTFEDYQGTVVRADERPDVSLFALRARFFDAIEALDCSSRLLPELTYRRSPLDLLLLTKRPENILRMVPASWLTAWPPYVWIGTSVGTQASAEERIPHLLRVPAAVRFLSVEPQLEAVDLGEWLDVGSLCGAPNMMRPPISWVIQGGEYHRDRNKARPFDLAWARSLRGQCKAAGVPYFLKQLGAQPTHYELNGDEGPALASAVQRCGVRVFLNDSHGGDESEWPADLRGCRAWPEVRP